ncbi:MAG TPA: hypothetical protein VFM18_08630 [Methanosarcina sp.]|nr:hypothetical protein [Methanosarcina sp.]
MKLHIQGVKLPPLGSIQDRIYRQYLVKEAQLEAKRTEFSMMTLLTNPQISEDVRWKEWRGNVRDMWQQYVSMLFHLEVESQSSKDKESMDYYVNVVKHSKLQMFRDRSGRLRLSGIDTLLPKKT